MYKKNLVVFGALILFIIVAAVPSMAKVSPEEAAKLKTDLTPFGAERSGNAEGTIPAWDGGIKEPPEGLGYKGPGYRHPDPYANDKVLFSITAKNVEQYADKLIEGQKALLKKYPDTYRIDVYPTHRPHAMPEWIYENTFKNATRAELIPDQMGLIGAYGGIAFPIPKNGEEVIWNHLTRWRHPNADYLYSGYMVQSNGDVLTTSGGRDYEKIPYFIQDQNIEEWNGDYFYLFCAYSLPARRQGEVLVIREPMNATISPRKAWQYLVGQRRVRRAPTIAYDTPNPGFSGQITYDDAYMFNGGVDRYNWKLVGKKEMIVPYNCYKADQQVVDLKKIYTVGHVSPDYLRWELHRVWIVEANLKPGKRHIYAKRVFLLDEDSWQALLNDHYDGRGSLWKTNLGVTLNDYALPGVVLRNQVHYDLHKTVYCLNWCQTEYPKITYDVPPEEDSFYTPEQVRRMGRR